MSNYFAIFYVLGILLFGLFIRIRFKKRNNVLKRELAKKKKVDKELAKKIMEDARSQRRARGISDDS